MSKKYTQNQFLRTVWKKPECFPKTEFTENIAQWLLFPGSFTVKVQKIFSDQKELKIQVVKEGLEIVKKSSYENYLFNCRYVYTRYTKIYWGDCLLMYAKSVLPKDAALIYKWQYRSLGMRPLGQMLFDSRKFDRSPFEIAKIWPHYSEFDLATDIPETELPFLWARRSVFSTKQQLIVLNEIFSPDLIRLINEHKSDC